MMTEVEARTKGTAMMRKLKGTGWKLSVHENCGWYFSAHNKYISIHESHGKFFALFSIKPENVPCGDSFWPDSGHFDDPQEAVEAFMKEARFFLNNVRRAVDYTEKHVLVMRR
ncbi:MAG: hypothetical protein WC919_01415 [Candidatus Paceibacterota bacterium]|jgi:hypothetical protein